VHELRSRRSWLRAQYGTACAAFMHVSALIVCTNRNVGCAAVVRELQLLPCPGKHSERCCCAVAHKHCSSRSERCLHFCSLYAKAHWVAKQASSSQRYLGERMLLAAAARATLHGAAYIGSQLTCTPLAGALERACACFFTLSHSDHEAAQRTWVHPLARMERMQSVHPGMHIPTSTGVSI